MSFAPFNGRWKIHRFSLVYHALLLLLLNRFANRVLKGNALPQGVQGSPCRGLGCPQIPLFFSFSLGAEGSKREREGVFKGHRPLDPLKLTPMGVSPQTFPFFQEPPQAA